MPLGRPAAVAVMGTAQTLAWASSSYLPAVDPRVETLDRPSHHDPHVSMSRAQPWRCIVWHAAQHQSPEVTDPPTALIHRGDGPYAKCLLLKLTVRLYSSMEPTRLMLPHEPL